jgi:long-chain fatty acid transport protein
MRGGIVCAVVLGVAGVSSIATERDARASGFDVPEIGTEAMGRAGAWTARADTPLAAILNPAGLAGQKTGAVVDANLVWQKFCYQRFGSYPSSAIVNTNTTFEGNDYSGQPYPQVCKKNGVGDVNPNPAVFFNYAVNEKLGVALGVASPSAAGKSSWPDRVTTANGALAPGPQRYMLLEANGFVLSPTIAAGYEVITGVRLGLAFQATIASLKFSNITRSLYSNPNDLAESPNGDVRADLTVKKFFTPGVIFGALVSPDADVDIGAMLKISADIHATSGTVDLTGPYYGNGKSGQTPASSQGQVQDFRVAQPLELRLGLRWHPRRKDAPVTKPGARRDFLANDQFDIEIDGTYSHNSSVDALRINFGEDPANPGSGSSAQCVAFGTNSCANKIPADTTIPHNFRDTVGVRVGGEYVVLPNQLGVRIGGFFQGNGQDPDFAGLDTLPSSMFGLFAGATYRLSALVDLSIGFGHIFLHGLDNNGNGEVHGLTAVNSSTAIPCPDGTHPNFHTCNAVNSGQFTGGYTMGSIGAVFHL